MFTETKTTHCTQGIEDEREVMTEMLVTLFNTH